MDKEKALKDALLIPCQTQEHLALWLKTYLNVDLVDCTVSRYANINPLEAAWQVYEYALLNKTREPLNMLFVASRASQKTLMIAAVEVAILLHDRRDILHFAGSKDQTNAGYKYIKEFLTKKYIRDYLVGKATADGAHMLLPDYRNPTEPPKTVTLKVFSITPMSVQGQHAPLLSVDELLTLTFEKLKAYKDLAGVPIPTSDGRPYIRTEISSRKGAFSLVEDRISNAHKTKLKVRSWTAFEMTEKCPDDRSGVIPTTYFTNTNKGLAMEPEKFHVLSPVEQVGFSEITAFDGCAKCPLLPSCNGDAKKQISKSQHLKSIEAVITEYINNSLEWWLSQKMSLMPDTSGLVYSKFKRDTHVKSTKEMWEIATGQKIDYTPTVSQLVEKFFQIGCRSYCGVDHTGGTAPCAVVITFVDPQQRVYVVDESYVPGMELEDLIAVLLRFKLIYKFSAIFPDPASADKNRILKKSMYGFRVLDNFKKDVSAGIEASRSKIMSASGAVSFYVLDENTENFQSEIGKYHYEESPTGEDFLPEPAKEYNHLMDAFRYIFQNIFLKGNNMVVPELTQNEINPPNPNATSNAELDTLIQIKMKEIINKQTDGENEKKVQVGDGFIWSIE